VTVVRQAELMIVNDVHSRLNATRADQVVTVDSLTALCRAVTDARGSHLTVAGGRHAMGGQQFGSGSTVLDTRPMARVLGFDQRQGHIEVEAGIQWPELVDYLLAAQQGRVSQWGIAQKQTGANFFTVGGSVSANCHGRGLTMAPIVHDVESLRLVRSDGSVVTCSRQQNPELFGLVVGGYGLFGAVYSVTPRRLIALPSSRRVSILITAGCLNHGPTQPAAVICPGRMGVLGRVFPRSSDALGWVRVPLGA